jgi:adenylate cyclase
LENATVVFTDFVNFTKKSRGIKPLPLINFLNHVFSRFDTVAKLFGVEKIKTIGDGYMV